MAAIGGICLGDWAGAAAVGANDWSGRLPRAGTVATEARDDGAGGIVPKFGTAREGRARMYHLKFAGNFLPGPKLAIACLPVY